MINKLVHKLDLRDISNEIISARKNLKLGFIVDSLTYLYSLNAGLEKQDDSRTNQPN